MPVIQYQFNQKFVSKYVNVKYKLHQINTRENYHNVITRKNVIDVKMPSSCILVYYHFNEDVYYSESTGIV